MSEPVRVALLVAPDSFERFYGEEGLGLSLEDYVHRYRNDYVWTYAEALRHHGVALIAYVPALAGSSRHSADDGFSVRFVGVPAGWDRWRFVISRAVTPIERYAGEAAHAALLLPQLRRGLREDGIDVLYLQEYWTGRFDVLSAAVELPVVAGEHGGSGGLHVDWFKRRALRRAAAITVQSTAEQRRLRRYGREAERITNGVDTTFFTPDPAADRPPRMLMVARLVDAQKRIGDGISALASLPEPWGLDIVGRGPDEEQLRAQVRERGLEARVTFHGWVASRSELREHYRRCGVFVLPSRWEAVTLAMLEAMACGAPAVVTPLPAFRDVIVDGHNGAFVPVCAPEALAAAVQAAYADRASIGAAARRTVETAYDRATTMGELARILRHAADADAVRSSAP